MGCGIATKCIYGDGKTFEGDKTGAISFPIYQTATYAHPEAGKSTGFDYSRLQNPTRQQVENVVASLEGGVDALAFSTGMAAITMLMEIFKPGDHIITDADLYGGSIRLFDHVNEKNGLTFSHIDCTKEGIEAYIQENTKAVFIETLGNPHSNIIDIEELAKIAHKHNIPLVVDSTFATPYLVRPIEFGADIVVHSATKFIGGHGAAIGGVIIDGGTFDWKASGKYPWISDPNPSYHGVSFADAAGAAAFATYIRAILLRDTGSTISPFHAFMVLQGLETLSLRVERHVENALKIVEYLNNHPQVEAVHHPSLESEPSHKLYAKYFPNGGGSIFTFEIKGDDKTAQKFIDNLEIFSLLANVADVKSLVIHPASTTHSQLSGAELEEQGIKPNTIRLSIGIENVQDLIEALDKAFKAVE